MEGKDVLLRDFNNVYIFPRAYKDNKGNIIADGLITPSEKNNWNTASDWVSANSITITSHIANTTIHVTAEEKSNWLKVEDVYPKNSVIMNTTNVAPTYTGMTWVPIGSSTVSITVGTTPSVTTIYYFQRTV